MLSSFISCNCKSLVRSVDHVRTLCRRADIIALQETWLFPHNLPSLGTVDPDFDYCGKSAIDSSAGLVRGRPYGGVAMLWRKSAFSSVTVIPCNSVRLAAIKVVVCDRSFVVFSVYMPVNSVENLVEFTDCLSEISAIIDNTEVANVYILGDFNACPCALFGRELLNFCKDQKWVCADIDKLGFSSGTFTFVSDAHGSTSWLDHCVVTKSAWQSVVDVRVNYDCTWSDHYPLEVRCNIAVMKPQYVSLESTPNGILWADRDEHQKQLYTRMCNDNFRKIDFPLELSGCCDGVCHNKEHRVVIDRMYESIVSTMCEAAMSSSSSACKRKRKRVVLGWNKHVRGAHEVARLDFQNWLLFGRPTDGPIYSNMVESRRRFKSKLRWCQNNAEQLKMDILATHHASKNFKNFWKGTKNLNNKPTAPINVNGVTGPRDIANMFRNHFQMEPPSGGLGMLNASEIRQKPLKPAVIPSFTAKDIATVIMNMTRGKSPGHDGISIEHLQHAGVHLPRVLAMFYTFCLRHSYLPDECMKTVVVPIIKDKTGDASDRSNYRPISLATTVAKVLDGLLDRILNNHIKLNDAQFGFRQGLSTETAVLCLKHTVRYYTDRKTPVYACFLDLSKAFDLVSYDVLWYKMRAETSLPEEVINIFDYWYNNQVNVIRWAGVNSDAYRLKCGVRQGGLTSPRLFNLYVNGLIERLSSANVGCSIDGKFINNISYADDMVLLGPSISAVRKLLAICVDYAGAHGLRYNVQKSELLVFQSAGHKILHVPPVSIDGVSLPRVSKFKYLGHWVSDDLSDHDDIERERRALAVRCNMLARRFARCTKAVKVTLFRAFCQSFYTCSLWVKYTQKTINALRVQYNNAFRMLMRLPRHCSASGMFADARVDGFHAILRKRAASLLSRVRGSGNSILSVVASRADCPLLWHCIKLHVEKK